MFRKKPKTVESILATLSGMKADLEQIVMVQVQTETAILDQITTLEARQNAVIAERQRAAIAVENLQKFLP